MSWSWAWWWEVQRCHVVERWSHVARVVRERRSRCEVNADWSPRFHHHDVRIPSAWRRAPWMTGTSFVYDFVFDDALSLFLEYHCSVVQFPAKHHVSRGRATIYVVLSARNRDDDDNRSAKRDASSRDDGIVTLIVFSPRSRYDTLPRRFLCATLLFLYFVRPSGSWSRCLWVVVKVSNWLCTRCFFIRQTVFSDRDWKSCFNLLAVKPAWSPLYREDSASSRSVDRLRVTRAINRVGRDTREICDWFSRTSLASVLLHRWTCNSFSKWSVLLLSDECLSCIFCFYCVKKWLMWKFCEVSTSPMPLILKVHWTWCLSSGFIKVLWKDVTSVLGEIYKDDYTKYIILLQYNLLT